ncbi:MAG: hypothetical protein ACOC16_00225 [Nanoarchaeota archaeon]
MERTDKTNSILRQFKKKSKRVINKDFFTEFFYLNRHRRAIEFLFNQDELILEEFLKKFLPLEFQDFVELKLLNDSEEEIRTWYYDNENLVLVLKINWGFRKEEISIDVDIENFCVTSINEEGFVFKQIDYYLLNEFIISFITNQANNLSKTFENIVDNKKKQNIDSKSQK